MLKNANIFVGDGEPEACLIDQNSSIDVCNDDIGVDVTNLDNDGRRSDFAALVSLDTVLRIGEVDAERSDACDRLDHE